MSDRDPTDRLDEIDNELAALRERSVRYRRAMLASRLAILAAMAILVGGNTIVPALGSTAITVTAIACALGATVWLGATKSSKEELDAKLHRTEAERTMIFDRIAAYNGWDDGARPVWPRRVE